MTTYLTTIDGTEYEVELLEDGQVRVNDRIYQVDLEQVNGQLMFSLLVEGYSYEASLTEEEDRLQIVMEGERYSAEVIDEHEKLLREAGSDIHGGGEFTLNAPMPGMVVKVPVQVGDQVAAGDVLVILESMKMQNELKAPRAGRVTAVHVQDGANVEKREAMVVLGPLEEEKS